MPSVKLGELLVRAKLLQEHQLRAALAEQKRWGGKLGDILVRMNANFEDVIVRALSKQLNIPIADIAALQSLSPEVLRRIPVQTAESLCVLPLGFRDEGRALAVAMAEPQNLHHVDTLRAVSGHRIAPYIAAKRAIIQGLGRFYNSTITMEASSPGGPEEFHVLGAQNEYVKSGEPSTVGGPAPMRATLLSVAEEVSGPAASTPPPLKGSPRTEMAEIKAILEILIEKGLVTREEYLARVRRLSR